MARAGRVVYFKDYPLLRVVPVHDGWQVQSRDHEESDYWEDVKGAWGKTKREASDLAHELC